MLFVNNKSEILDLKKSKKNLSITNNFKKLHRVYYRLCILQKCRKQEKEEDKKQKEEEEEKRKKKIKESIKKKVNIARVLLRKFQKLYIIKKRSGFSFQKSFKFKVQTLLKKKELKKKYKNKCNLTFNTNCLLYKNFWVEKVILNFKVNVLKENQVEFVFKKNKNFIFFDLFVKKYFIFNFLKVKKMFFYYIKELVNIIKFSLNSFWNNIILKWYFFLNKNKKYNEYKSFLYFSFLYYKFIFKKEDQKWKKKNNIANEFLYLNTNIGSLKQFFILKLKSLKVKTVQFLYNIKFERQFFTFFFMKNLYNNISVSNFTMYSILFFILNLKNKKKVLESSFNFYINKLKLKTFFTTGNFFEFSTYFLKQFSSKLNLGKKELVKKYIWKKGVVAKRKYFQLLTKKQNLSFYKKSHNFLQREISLNFLFWLQKIEEKISLTSNLVHKEKLNLLRNVLFNFWQKKEYIQRGFSFFVSTRRKVRKFKNQILVNIFKVLRILITNLFKNKKIEVKTLKENKLFFVKLYKKLFKQKQYKLFFKLKKKKKVKKFKLKKKIKKWRYLLKVRKIFKVKRVVKRNNYITLERQKELVSFLLNKKVSIFYINALSLSRFAFTFLSKNNTFNKDKKKSSNIFLQNIVREMVNRYKYVAIYIKDLVYIGFISLFLKKATFLANFIAFQIKKLPKNRKETKFIRFIIKVVKVSAAQRTEVIGLRIKFKGRVNRWRRTKFIIGESGILSYQTSNSRMEYGSAKVINRKGALGISLWISYNPIFKQELWTSILKYQKYSSYLRLSILDRYYNNYFLKSRLKNKFLK